MYVCVPHVCLGPAEAKERVPEYLGLQSQTTVSCYVCAKIQTRVLSESSQCS